MHLANLKALTLLGNLVLFPSPAHAEKSEQELDMGYLQCASAVVKTTSFPSCTSSYKLDCFCEAQAQEKNAAGLPLTSASRVQLEPEVEEVCRVNGVPKEEITRYLCDDSAVPASPRRGSTPMVRLGKGMGSSSQNQDEVGEEDNDEGVGMKEASTSTSKRSIDSSETRLLIPENGNDQDEEPEETAPDAPAELSEDEPERIANIDTNTNSPPPAETAAAGFETITLTVTETVCACEETSTPAEHSNLETTPEPEPSSASIETHPVHGTEVAVAILSSTAALPTATSTESSSSVRLSSSSVVVSEPVPTGVDGLHGVNQDADGEGQGENGDVFEGGAGKVYFSRGLIVALLGFVGAVVLL